MCTRGTKTKRRKRKRLCVGGEKEGKESVAGGYFFNVRGMGGENNMGKVFRAIERKQGGGRIWRKTSEMCED